MLDAGVEDDTPADANGRRDAMLTTVLDRLEQDLRAAEEAGDEDRASQLRVRIERLEERRRELAEP
jgi:DNA-binding ferritin-like protein